VTTQPAQPSGNSVARSAELATLSEGQRACLRLVYQHMTSKDIARLLGVSPHTVDMRLRTAMRTLSVASRIEAARLLVHDELGSEPASDAYQPLIYQSPEIVPEAETPNLASPVSARDGGFDPTSHPDPRPDVGPPASGPPRLAGASVPFQEDYSPGGIAALAVDPGAGTQPLGETLKSNLPWGRRNDLSVGVRLAWILFIAIGSALGFGAVLAAMAALKALI